MTNAQYSLPDENFISICNQVEKYAQAVDDKIAYIFVKDNKEEIQLSYKDLDLKARSIALALTAKLSKGDRVLLVFNPGLEFIEAFFGCLYAGMVAVPAYPPSTNIEHWQRLLKIADNAEASLIIMDDVALKIGESQVGDQRWFNSIKCNYSSLGKLYADNWTRDKIYPDDLAFLQYTSGSTGDPKGVMVSHGNLMANQHFIKQKFGHDDETIVVGWLPQYHDMGLIGNILQPAFLGVRAILMSPASFLQQPILWLETISKYKATTSGAPNFGFEYCAKRITEAQKQSLDLSNWKLAFCGAEPVKPETLNQFYDSFKDSGFQYKAFYPCYGLAEITLMASGGDSASGPKSISINTNAYRDQIVKLTSEADLTSTKLMACGYFDSTYGAIIDPKTKLLARENEIGEIWLKGPSVTQGYWKNLKLTEQYFKAQIASCGSGAYYLRTGDLGFVHEDQLYITGRVKDLIIIRGKNYYPQDIEYLVQNSFEQLRTDHGACFSITVYGEEQLIYVQEIERTFLRKVDYSKLANDIRNTIRRNFNLNLHDIVLTKPNRVPKTSSGKVRRNNTKQLYLNSSLDAIYSDKEKFQQAEQNENETVEGQTKLPVFSAIQALIAKKLKINKQDVDLHLPISALGVDSIDSITLLNEIEKQFGIKIPLNELLSEKNIFDCIESSANAAGIYSQVDKGEQSTDKYFSDLSENQITFWKLNHLNENGHVYNLSAPLLFDQLLDKATLKAAIEQVTVAHPILCKTYREQSEHIVQFIANDNHINAIGVASDLETVRKIIAKNVNQKIDLDRTVPITFSLYPLKDGRSILHILAHHIVMDFWSMLVLVEKLLTSYKAICNKEIYQSNSSDNYQIYVERQRAQFSTEQYAIDLSKVVATLAGYVRPVPFVTDYSRPARFQHNGKDLKFKIAPHVATKIKKQCIKYKVTLYTYLLSVLQILLHRYSGASKFVIGTPVSQRNGSKEEAIIGCFVDMKMIPCQLDDSFSFREHLLNTKRTVNEVLKYSHVSTSHVLQHLKNLSESSYQQTPDTLLPNVRFVLHKAHILKGAERLLFSDGDQLEISGFKVSLVDTETSKADADIVLTISETGKELQGIFNFNTDIFSEQTIDNITDSYLQLLSSSLEHPETKANQLPIMSQNALSRLPGRMVTYSRNEQISGIHQLFEKQVLINPLQIAVKFKKEEISYHGLNVRANQLARHLSSLESTQGKKIGVSMSRGIDMVTAFLAILKINCSAVFFDQSTPVERRKLLQQSIALDYLITDSTDSAWCKVENSIIFLPETDLTSYDETNLNIENAETDVAYLLFTSGSTGVPKAVKGLHRGMLNRTEWMLRHFNMSGNETILHCTPMNAVRAEREIFFALSSGSTLAISEQMALHDPKVLIDELIKFSATFTASSPSMLEMMLNSHVDEFYKLQYLKHWFIGAELLKQSLVARIQQAMPRLKLTYFYGSTETSSDVSYYDLPENFNTKVPRIPVGKPLHNTELKVLDDNLMPLPPGVPGELYVSGKNLSGGYYRDEALTDEKFIQTHLNQEVVRLYKTGDLAYHGNDGNLYILGRKGNEINLLGNLISLTEIESTIEQLPQIESVTVIASLKTDAPRIIAYIVTNDASYKQIIKSHLHDKLPAYMHPAFIVKIDAIPLTPLGKIDRSKLPVIDSVDDLHRDVVPAEGKYETLIVNIWADILGVKASLLDINDGFFEMGGNSALVTKLRSRLHTELKSTVLNLKDIYKYPTIRKLALFLAQSNSLQQTDNTVSDRAQKRRNAMKRYRETS